jgi:hypothetical protein
MIKIDCRYQSRRAKVTHSFSINVTGGALLVILHWVTQLVLHH